MLKTIKMKVNIEVIVEVENNTTNDALSKALFVNIDSYNDDVVVLETSSTCKEFVVTKQK